MQEPQQTVSLHVSAFHAIFRLKSCTVPSEIVLTQLDSLPKRMPTWISLIIRDTSQILTTAFKPKSQIRDIYARNGPQMLGVNPDYDLHQTKTARASSCATLCTCSNRQLFGSNALSDASIGSLVESRVG